MQQTQQVGALILLHTAGTFSACLKLREKRLPTYIKTRILNYKFHYIYDIKVIVHDF